MIFRVLNGMVEQTIVKPFQEPINIPEWDIPITYTVLINKSTYLLVNEPKVYVMVRPESNSG